MLSQLRVFLLFFLFLVLSVLPTSFVFSSASCQENAPKITVYKEDGSLQCKPGSGSSLEEMEKELSQEGVCVYDRQKKKPCDLIQHPCDLSTGQLNTFVISQSDLDKVKNLEFSVWKGCPSY